MSEQVEKTKEDPKKAQDPKAKEHKAEAKGSEKTESKAEGKGEGKAEGKAIKKKKERKATPAGVVHIQATFNNTIITVTDPSGGVISWSSAGSSGFKGSKKSTPFAAQIASEAACKRAFENGMRTVEVRVKGPGAGREAALRAVQSAGLKVSLIEDVTPIPHNGCRPAKKRRV